MDTEREPECQPLKLPKIKHVRGVHLDVDLVVVEKVMSIN
jgi:hypothetical protein